MDDQHNRIAETLQPVMDAAVGLGTEYATPDEALRALRRVETAVEFATDTLMRDLLAAAE